MKKAISLLGFGVLTTLAALSACSSDKTKSGEATGNAKGDHIQGAIWTTTEDGSIVNKNHYDDCRQVYLNGGPHGGSKKGLPAGDYVFIVTDPDGTVLSTDGESERTFRVGSDGRIEDYLGTTHDEGLDLDANAMTVQLWPFSATPNPGGVYKAWIFYADDYVDGADLNKLPHKTDNFKCDRATPPTDAGVDAPPDAPMPDTGVPPTDTGVPPTDTGVPPTDTGVPPTDTGVPVTDTGVPPSDTGGEPPPECEDEECIDEL